MLEIRINIGTPTQMKAKWFGDSYDLVKRFFVGIATNNGYVVYADPTSIGDWEGQNVEAFLRFIGIRSLADRRSDCPSAVFPRSGYRHKQ